LAMGSKESAIATPVLVLIYDRVFLSSTWGKILRRRWGLYLGLAGTWLIVLTMLPAGREGTSIFTDFENNDANNLIGEGHHMLEYTVTQFGAITHYLRLCFWPYPLVVDYGYYSPQTFAQILPCAIFIGGLFIATLLAFRRWPWLGFLGITFFAILAPSSSFVPLFQQIAAEKRMYLPSAAVIICVVLGVYFLGQRLLSAGMMTLQNAKLSAMLLLAIVTATLGIAAFHRNAAYQDSLTIWQDVLDKMPNNIRAHYNLALIFANQKKLNLTQKHYEEALTINPKFPEAHVNLGSILINQGKLEDGIAHYKMAIQLKPNLPEPHSNLGSIYLQQGKIAEAEQQFKLALQIAPNMPDANHGYACVLTSQDRIDEAIELLKKILATNPNHAIAHGSLARMLVRKGLFREAAAEYDTVIQLLPDSPIGYDSLARLLAACPDASVRNGNEAIALAQKAVALSHGQEPGFISTLAAAYAEAGHFPEAIRIAQQAIDIAAQQNKPTVVESIRAKLRLYEANTPYRELPPKPQTPSPSNASGVQPN
jgi:protein O-mannosyl-transferase